MVESFLNAGIERDEESVSDALAFGGDDRKKLVEILLKAGAEADSVDLRRAIDKQDIDLVKFLLDARCVVDDNAIVSAIESSDDDRMSLVKLLMTYRFNKDSKKQDEL